MVLVVEDGEVDLEDWGGGHAVGSTGGGDCSWLDDGPVESRLARELDFFLLLLGLEVLCSLTLMACRLLFFLESGG